MIPLGTLERDVVILSCAISAGIHAALAPEHLDEGRVSGLGFVASAVLLGVAAVALTLRASKAVLITASSLLAGLIASHMLAVTAGVPLLHPDAEPIDGLAVATKLVEATGLLAALDLLRLGRPAVAIHLSPKGTTT